MIFLSVWMTIGLVVWGVLMTKGFYAGYGFRLIVDLPILILFVVLGPTVLLPFCLGELP